MREGRELDLKSFRVEERRQNVAHKVDLHRLVVQLVLLPEDRISEEGELFHVELTFQVETLLSRVDVMYLTVGQHRNDGYNG